MPTATLEQGTQLAELVAAVHAEQNHRRARDKSHLG